MVKKASPKSAEIVKKGPSIILSPIKEWGEGARVSDGDKLIADGKPRAFISESPRAAAHDESEKEWRTVMSASVFATPTERLF